MTIPANKKRVPIALILGILFLPAPILFVIYFAGKLNDNLFINAFYFGGFIGLLLAVLQLVIYAFLDYRKTIFDKTAALTITENGINDNLSIFSLGTVYWNEMTDFKVISVLRTNFLIIGVKNAESLIARKKYLLRRPVKRFLRKFGSPVFISQKRIEFNVYDLKDILVGAKPK